MTVAFTCAVFLGALLLFLVQPMMGKVLLPLLGGAPGVWNVCMVSFQVLLLAAYLYAHLLSRLRPRTQVAVHSALALAVVLALPIGLAEGSLPPVDGSPVFWVLVALARSVGLPFFMLAATAPLVQRWLSLTDHRSAASRML